jgi:7-cyano-7-deazaguanine synthase in queuosine biosynthesis
MTRPVIVLGNGASARRVSSKKRLELEYRENTGRLRNIRVGLPNFIRSVFHLPPRMIDLLELAVFVFAADRLVTRGRRDAAVYDAWARTFEFRIRVRDVDFWRRTDVCAALAACLVFMTGDRSYSFQFEGGHSTPPTGLFDADQFVIPSSVKPDVMLFSGGLDSLAGAIDLLDQGRTVCLVSHSSQSGTTHTQKILTQALQLHPSYRDRVRPYQFDCTLGGIKAVEETQRTRAFLYTSIAFALQYVFSADHIYVFENGVTSFNFPRREDQTNARASRTTHPKTMRLLEVLFSLVADRPIKIAQPFLWKTKVDVLGKIQGAGHEMLIASSVSCSETRTTRTRPQCGNCFQCIDRRLAAFAARVTDADHPGLYEHDVNTEPLTGEARTVAIDYLRQARDFAQGTVNYFEQQYINELVDILDGLHPLREAQAVEQVWMLCRQHGSNVHRAVEQIRAQFDDPYLMVVPDSLADLIRQREHLKEPITRAISAFISIVEPGLERLYAGDNKPKNENEFNRGVAAICGAVRVDLRSEHPTARFACAGVVPDHELEDANVVIESKYVRDGTPPSKISDGMAADLIKYPPDRHILFVVYDPGHLIRDTRLFISDFESRGRCTVRVLR